LKALKGRDHLGDVGMDERIGCELDSAGSESGPVAGSCEPSNESLGFIKGREFSDQLIDYKLVKDSVLWSLIVGYIATNMVMSQFSLNISTIITRVCL
jgi:hypothetical protein